MKPGIYSAISCLMGIRPITANYASISAAVKNWGLHDALLIDGNHDVLPTIFEQTEEPLTPVLS